MRTVTKFLRYNNRTLPSNTPYKKRKEKKKEKKGKKRKKKRKKIKSSACRSPVNGGIEVMFLNVSPPKLIHYSYISDWDSFRILDSLVGTTTLKEAIERRETHCTQYVSEPTQKKMCRPRSGDPINLINLFLHGNLQSSIPFYGTLHSEKKIHSHSYC